MHDRKNRRLWCQRLRKICDVKKIDEHTSYVDLHVMVRFRACSRNVVGLGRIFPFCTAPNGKIFFLLDIFYHRLAYVTHAVPQRFTANLCMCMTHSPVNKNRNLTSLKWARNNVFIIISIVLS